VGARLIRDALGRAEEAGEPAVMVEGIPAYYPRFGFEHASALGFISPHPKIPVDAFMVKRLAGYSPGLAVGSSIRPRWTLSGTHDRS
jgi:putative acetyltransferase